MIGWRHRNRRKVLLADKLVHVDPMIHARDGFRARSITSVVPQDSRFQDFQGCRTAGQSKADLTHCKKLTQPWNWALHYASLFGSDVPRLGKHTDICPGRFQTALRIRFTCRSHFGKLWVDSSASHKTTPKSNTALVPAPPLLPLRFQQLLGDLLMWLN